jgi:hypothetical protein
MEVNYPKSRYHDCLKIEFQHFFDAKPRNVAVVRQQQAMTGNDKQVSEHGTNHGISGKRQKKDYANQVTGRLVNYRVGVTS